MVGIVGMVAFSHVAVRESCMHRHVLLEQARLERRRIDNLVLLTSSQQYPAQLEQQIKHYRRDVNNDLLYVRVNSDTASDGSPSIEPCDTGNPANDVTLTGFSDSILRFVAERGSGGQLDYVNSIDRVKGVRAAPTVQPELTFPVASDESAVGHGAGVGAGAGAGVAMREAQGRRLNRAVAPMRQVSPVQGDVLRIFLSSTFADMACERDLVQNHVLPVLRERCRATGRTVRLVDVDLRWGVTAHEAREGGHHAIARCLEQAASSDVLVAFVGERYGWTPPAETVLAAVEGDEQLAPLRETVAAADKPVSITELELRLGLMLGVKSNGTQRHGLVYLRSKLGDVPSAHAGAFKTHPKDQHAIRALRATLRHLEPSARGPAGATITAKCSPYVAKWKPPSQAHRGTPHEHGVVRGLAPLRDQLIDDLWAVIESRCPAATSVPQPATASTAATSAAARAAAQEAQAQLSARLDGAATCVGREALLRSVVQWACGGEYRRPLTEEEQADADFESGRGRWRKQGDTGDGQGARPGATSTVGVMVGAEGAGKSSLLAKVAAVAAEQRGMLVVSHFVRAGEHSARVETALLCLCQALRKVCPPSEDALPTTLDGLRVLFPKLLRLATAEARILVVIDAADGFEPSGGGTTSSPADDIRDALALVPDVQSPRLRVLVGLAVAPGAVKRSTSRHGGRSHRPAAATGAGADALTAEQRRAAVRAGIAAAFQQRRAAVAEIVLPALTQSEASAIVASQLWLHGKKLEEKPGDNQMRNLVRKREAGSPLYLSLAVANLLSFGHFEKLSEYVRGLPTTSEALCVEALRQLEAIHTPAAVARACSLLATARGGLTSEEIASAGGVFVEGQEAQWSIDIPAKDAGRFAASSSFSAPVGATSQLRTVSSLSSGRNQRTAAPARSSGNGDDNGATTLTKRSPALPALRWERLRAALLPYCRLSPHTGRIGLAFPVFERAVRRRYLNGRAPRRAAHVRLLTMFQDAADPLQNASWAGLAARPLAEALFHAGAAGRGDALAAMLCNLAFLSAAVYHGLLANVMQAYARARSPAMAFAHRSRSLASLAECEAFVAANLSGLTGLANAAAARTDGVFQRAANWVAGTAPQVAAQHWRASTAHVADGSEAVSLATATKAAAFQHAWLDRVNKRTEAPACHAQVTVSADEATAVAVSPDGATVAVASKDWKISLVTADGWVVRASLAGHRAAVRHVVFSPTGRLLVSCGEDGTALCWSVAEAKVRARFTQHRKPVNMAAFFGSDSLVVTASDDATVSMWSTDTGKGVKPALRAHTRPVTSVQTTRDCAYFATGSWDGTAIVWQVQSTSPSSPAAKQFRRLVHTAQGGSGDAVAVRCVAWAPTTVRKLATACFDGSVWVFDTEAGAPLATLVGHLGPSCGLAFTSDGSRLVSTGEDGTVRLWRGNAAGGQLRCFIGHTRSVTSCALIGDARRVGWAGDHVEAVVSVAADGQLRGWAVPDSTVKLAPETRSPVTAVAAAGSQVLVSRFDGSVGAIVVGVQGDVDASTVEQPRGLVRVGGREGMRPPTLRHLKEAEAAVESKGSDLTDESEDAAGLRGGVLCMDVSTSGLWVATGHEDGVRVWSCDGNLHHHHATEGAVLCARFMAHPRGSDAIPPLLAGTSQSAVVWCDFTRGLTTGPDRVTFVEAEVVAMAAHPTEPVAFVGVRATGIFSVYVALGVVWVLCMWCEQSLVTHCISPCRYSVHGAYDDSGAYELDIVSEQRLPEWVTSMALSQDAEWLAIGTYDGGVHVSAVPKAYTASQRMLASQPQFTVSSGTAPVSALAFFAGSTLMSGTKAGVVTAWRFPSQHAGPPAAVSSFTCNAACSALCALPATSEVFVGDALGHVYCLRVHDGVTLPKVATPCFPSGATEPHARSSKAPANRRAAPARGEVRTVVPAGGARRRTHRLSREAQHRAKLAACTDTIGLLQAAGLFPVMGLSQ